MKEQVQTHTIQSESMVESLQSNDSLLSDYEYKLKELKKLQYIQRENLSLTSRPFDTLKFFFFALGDNAIQLLKYFFHHWIISTIVFSLFLILTISIRVKGFHQDLFHTLFPYFRFALWWLSLGILSSIGLGSGLHTFVLYLGPHIAKFTMKATVCGTVDIKQSIYDTAQWGMESKWAMKECSEFFSSLSSSLASLSSSSEAVAAVTAAVAASSSSPSPPVASSFPFFPSEHGGYYSIPLLSLMASVQLESFLWGVGTAIGELPPYFVSKAARLSGEKLKELEEWKQISYNPHHISLFKRIKNFIFSRAENFGFFTILAFASFPNPLFDLAGITCGHFLIPFWKFFLATLIGKSIIKTNIQALFIITVFNTHSIEMIEAYLEKIMLRNSFLVNYLPHLLSLFDSVRQKFIGAETKKSSPFSIASLWSTCTSLMLFSFLGSIIQTMAKSYLVKYHNRQIQTLSRQIRPNLQPN